MISNSTEKSCLRVDASGVEDNIDCRLHLSTLCLLVHRWRAHGAIGVKRPWIRCCGDVGDNRESISDGSHGGGTVSGGSGGGSGSGGIGLLA